LEVLSLTYVEASQEDYNHTLENKQLPVLTLPKLHTVELICSSDDISPVKWLSRCHFPSLTRVVLEAPLTNYGQELHSYLATNASKITSLDLQCEDGSYGGGIGVGRTLNLCPLLRDLTLRQRAPEDMHLATAHPNLTRLAFETRYFGRDDGFEEEDDDEDDDDEERIIAKQRRFMDDVETWISKALGPMRGPSFQTIQLLDLDAAGFVNIEWSPQVIVRWVSLIKKLDLAGIKFLFSDNRKVSIPVRTRLLGGRNLFPTQ
jgi:hypothetical protein